VLKELIKDFNLNKKRKKGRPSYPLEAIFNTFLLMFFKGIKSERELVKYLRENPEEAKLCGLRNIPDRRTIGRFRKKISKFVS